MKGRPKIAMVVTSVLAVRWFLAPHLRALAETYEVVLIVRNDFPDELAHLDLPVRIIEIPITRKISPILDLVTLCRLWSIFSKERFDLVHTVTPKAGLLGIIAAGLAGVPLRVHTFQGELWVHRRGLMRWLLRSLDKLVGWAATQVTVVSRSELEFLEAENILFPAKGQVLGAGSICGVDTDRFRPQLERRKSFRAELALAEKTTVFLFVGRLCADKGLPTLVEAVGPLFADNQDIALLVVGPDEENMVQYLETTLRQTAGNRLQIFPYTRTPEQFISAADVLVLPSVREGFGMVILEAAAMGVPSIGTDIYGIRDAIAAGRTGLLFPLSDSRALADCMSLLAKDPDYRAGLGEAARKRANSEFSQASAVQNLLMFYDKLLR